MSDKVQIGPLISVEARAMLEQMCKDDTRALGNWLDRMIRYEHARRQSTTDVNHVLVDTPEPYVVEEPRILPGTVGTMVEVTE